MLIFFIGSILCRKRPKVYSTVALVLMYGKLLLSVASPPYKRLLKKLADPERIGIVVPEIL